jgi:hypothetical protein
MASIVFLEPGGDATGGLEFWTSSTGTITVDNQWSARTGPDALSLVQIAKVTKSGVLAAAGRRVSVSVVTNNLASLGAAFMQFNLSNGTGVFHLSMVNGHVTVMNPATFATFGTGTATLNFSQRYRVAVSYTISSTTVNRIKVWVDGVLDIDLTNVTLPQSAADTFVLQGCNSGVTPLAFFDNVYIDDGTTLDDPGNVKVTAKLPAALNTNSFDTLGGSGTNRYDRVSDRPLSIANFIEHAGGTDVQENFGLQALAVGDVDLTGATILGRAAWIYAKQNPILGTGTPKATGSGTSAAAGTTITATLSAAVVAGDLVVIVLADQMTSTTTPTISDSAGGNTWTSIRTSTNTVRQSAFYCVVTNGASALVITATFTSQTASRSLAACAWDNTFFGASPLDVNPVNATDSVTPFTCPLTGTLAQTSELVLSFVSSAGVTGFTATSPNLLGISVPSAGTTTAGSSCAIGYQVVAATTSIAPVFAGTSRTSVEGVCSFKLVAAATRTAGTPKIMDNGVETAQALTSAAALYTLLTTSASYPSNAAGIGMRSAGASGQSVFMYDCGTVIAFIPAVGTWKTMYGATIGALKTLAGVSLANIKTVNALTPP